MADSAQYTPETIARRLKVAESLLGAPAQPIRHWSEGLNELLKGYTGGQIHGNAERAEREGAAATNQFIASMLSAQPMPGAAPSSAPGAPPTQPPGPPPPIRPGTPSPMPPAPMGPMANPNDANDPTMTVSPRQVALANPGGVPAASTGIPTPAPPQQPASTGGAPMTPQGPSAAPSPVATQPQMTDARARLAAGLSNPNPFVRRAAQGMGMQAVAQAMKPPEMRKLNDEQLFDQHTGRVIQAGPGYRALTSPEERAAHGIPADDRRPYQIGPGNKLVNPPAENRISMNTVADPILGGIGTQFVEARKIASEVPNRINTIHDARRLLDEGATLGQFADQRVFLQKVGSLFGLDAAQASNTEVLRSTIGRNVLANIKTLGANPSNTDRDYIEKVVGGQIALEERSIRRVLDIEEKYARQALRNFNRDSKLIIERNPEAYRSVAPLMNIQEPPEYGTQPPSGSAPNANTGSPVGTTVRKFNPQTGRIE